MTDTRAYQAGLEAIRSDTPETQVKQAGVEVVRSDTPETQVKQAGLEAIRSETSLSTRIYQAGIELIYRTGTIIVDAIATGEVVFALGLMPAISLAGIDSGEDVVAFSVGRTINAGEIESAETVYQPFLINRGTVVLETIPTAESVEAISLQKQLTLGAINSAEAFYDAVYVVGENTVILPEIASAESLGVHTLEHADPPRTMRYRVVSTEYGPPGLILAEIVEEDTGNYPLSLAKGGTPDAGAAQVSPVPGSSKLVLMDSVMARDQDNDAGYYVAVSGFNSSWPGAIVEKSGDGGSSYDDILTVQSEAVLGRAVSALGDTSRPYTWDEVNTVDIQVLKPSTYEIASDTEDNVLNGSNAGALIKSNGEVELIQWVTSTAVSPGIYRLSQLLRSRRGSDFATAGHAIGDRFVVLDELTVSRVSASLGEIGLARLYKAVTLGTLASEAMVVPFTNSGASLKPLSPVQITGSRDGSNNLTLTAVRRSRIGGEWRDYVDVPLGEASERYEIDIYSGSTVVRTITGLTSPTTVYSAANQTADGLTPGDPVSLRWYQLSESVGRGFAGVATV